MTSNDDRSLSTESAEAKRARSLANLQRGRKRGVKNKATLAVEALKAVTADMAGGVARNPLGVILSHMNRAQSEFERLLEAELPAEEDALKAHLRALRVAQSDALEAAQAAAPYVHAKLASVESKVKAGLKVTVRQFGAKKDAGSEVSERLPQKDGDGEAQ